MGPASAVDVCRVDRAEERTFAPSSNPSPRTPGNGPGTPPVVTIRERRTLEETRPPYLSGVIHTRGLAFIRSHSLVPAKA